MKFGINFQLQTPRPLDANQWHEHDELKIYHEALEQIEFADKLGYDYVFITEHHFLELYTHHPLSYHGVPGCTPLLALLQPRCTPSTIAYHGVPPRLQ